jgi:hypothetical protein
MSLFQIRVYPREGDGIIITDSTSILPPYQFEANNLATIDHHLGLRLEDARKTGKVCAVSVMHKSGRRPNGFNEHRAVRHFVPVN